MGDHVDGLQNCSTLADRIQLCSPHVGRPGRCRCPGNLPGKTRSPKNERAERVIPLVAYGLTDIRIKA